MSRYSARNRTRDSQPGETRMIRWTGSDDQLTEYSVTVGYYLDGRPGEVFANGAKVGSAMRALLEDACVVVSLALQHGIEPSALAHSLARVPVSETESAPASVIGAVVELLAEGLGVVKTEVARK